MGWLFRKSFKILPGVRVNFGKRGLTSTSIGPRGLKLNIGKLGTFLTSSIRGTGLSYRAKLSGPASSSDAPSELVWYCSRCSLANRLDKVMCVQCRTPRPAISSQPMFNDRPIKDGAIALGVLALVGFCGLIVIISRLTNGPAPPSQPAALVAPVRTPIPVSSPTPTPTKLAKGKKPAKNVAPVPLPPVSYGSTDSDPAPRRSAVRSSYIRGPRGGCYYINRNGNKTYVDRSLCN